MEPGGLSTSAMPKGKRLRLVLAAAIIVAILIIAGFVLMLPGPRARLVITDGSITGTVKGDFLNMNASNGLYSYFNATTYARQPGHPDSELTLRLVWSTRGAETDFLVSVLGDLDSNLSIDDLHVVINQTASHSGLDSLGIQQRGTNVSFDESTECGILNNGSGTLSAKFVNRTMSDPHFLFSYSDAVHIRAFDEGFGASNIETRFYCIRATVNGWFEPTFSVSISLSIVDTSAAS